MTMTMVRGTRTPDTTPAAGTSFALDVEYDWVLVDLTVRGDRRNEPLTPADRVEIVRRLNSAGLTDPEIEDRTGIPCRTVQRIRGRLHIDSALPIGLTTRSVFR